MPTIKVNDLPVIDSYATAKAFFERHSPNNNSAVPLHPARNISRLWTSHGYYALELYSTTVLRFWENNTIELHNYPSRSTAMFIHHHIGLCIERSQFLKTPDGYVDLNRTAPCVLDATTKKLISPFPRRYRAYKTLLNKQLTRLYKKNLHKYKSLQALRGVYGGHAAYIDLNELITWIASDNVAALSNLTPESVLRVLSHHVTNAQLFEIRPIPANTPLGKHLYVLSAPHITGTTEPITLS